MGLFDFLFKSIGFRRYSVSADVERAIQSDWEKIEQMIKQGTPSHLRQALITADRSLDSALKAVADGTTMGERLKNSKNRFEPYFYNQIWEAHKMRNSLVHEAGFEPPHYVLKTSIDTLKKAIISLGVNI